MKETRAWRMNGFAGFFLALLLIVAATFAFSVREGLMIFLGFVFSLAAVMLFSGLTVVQPNQSRVVTFFGRYMGSVRDAGMWVTIPFSGRQNVSLRVSNFNSKTLKVNDIEGNPVEIAAVVVYRVINTARAVFDVDDYEEFIEIQSETALRHVATRYPYDDFGDEINSLRGNPDEVASELARELQERLAVAGVEVLEARLTHLAYATEIASAMLQRQQATAIVSARQKIVEGAVGMAQMAIAQLEKENIIELDEERKVAMINNLMVAIVSERGAQPVINAGTLY